METAGDWPIECLFGDTKTRGLNLEIKGRGRCRGMTEIYHFASRRRKAIAIALPRPAGYEAPKAACHLRLAWRTELVSSIVESVALRALNGYVLPEIP
jgi:hypothetical protein